MDCYCVNPVGNIILWGDVGSFYQVELYTVFTENQIGTVHVACINIL